MPRASFDFPRLSSLFLSADNTAIRTLYHPSLQTLAFRYSLAVVLVLLSLSLPRFFLPFSQVGVPFLFGFAAIIFSSWQGGLGPGLFATLLTAFYFSAFFPSPAALMLYLLEGFSVSYINFRGRRKQLSRYQQLVLERSARTRAEEERNRFEFLSEAGKLLSSSADQQTILKSIAKLAVPTLSDWCVVDLIGSDGRVRHEAIGGQNPEHFDPSVALGKVLRTGKAELLTEIPPPQQKLARKSVMIVPLILHSKIIGAITFVTAQSGRVYSRDDLYFAQDLATRATVSLNLVKLYESAKQEIKERKKIQTELHHSRDQLDVILKNVADGITVQDHTGKIIYTNDAAAKLIGLGNTSQPFIPFQLVTEEGEPLPPSRLPSRLALEKKTYSEAVVKFPVPKDSGEISERWSIVRSTPVLNAEKNIEFVVNVFQDITERKFFETRKDEFLAMASHELKTPLTSIKAFAQIIAKHAQLSKDQQAIGYISKMDSQLDRLSQLIQGLLDVTKIRAGKLELKPTHFDLTLLATEICDSLSPTTSHPLKVSTSAHVRIFADRDRIAQVLMNLLTNAIKYSPENKPITVSLKKKESFVIVSVQDSGIGISTADQKKIFNRYYQVSLPSRAPKSGLGLGLYISSEIIRRHHGTMTVKSILGQGSTFSFTLPTNR